MQPERDGIDIAALIERAADQFEKDWGVKVLTLARQALIKPALEHRDLVLTELASGHITVPELQGKVLDQLLVARRIAERKRASELYHKEYASETGPPLYIDRSDAIKSIDEDCAYLFWC